eukprot:CAMPEP_0185771924 /NCGR_PEP_ID=MMETSP1174-20130828/65982_1 /TAXON_ID=35687 /ORGANISM="Dictyocha speculum, Strain CCMP1381" /LENGTH=140 /DNA_ID=CAMNT_0028457953 /DNA_START=75 /DNA_END=497 /DNA_ORIENTATION=-
MKLPACSRRGSMSRFLSGASLVLGVSQSQPRVVRAAEEPVKAQVFTGRYSDPNHPGGIRDITFSDTSLGGFQLVKVTGGGGRGEPAVFVLNGMAGPCGRGDQMCITIDFSPKGGPRDFTGYWDGDGIKFPDGNKWPKTTQ